MKHFVRKHSHLFILDRGEKLIETLTPALAKADLAGGMISGLGALMDVELGYYELHEKEYIRKTFTDDYELISLNGNVAWKDSGPLIHVHAALGDRQFAVFGGHLFEAKVAVTAEITVVPFDFAPERLYNDAVGLATICGIKD